MWLPLEPIVPEISPMLQCEKLEISPISVSLKLCPVLILPETSGDFRMVHLVTGEDRIREVRDI